VRRIPRGLPTLVVSLPCCGTCGLLRNLSDESDSFLAPWKVYDDENVISERRKVYIYMLNF